VTLARSPVRMLDDRSLDAVRGLLNHDVAANCVLAARLESAGSLDPFRLGGNLLTSASGADGITSACFVGGTVMPIGSGQIARAGAADVGAQLADQPRTCSSIVGDASNVLALWGEATRGWGPARLIRADQPLLVTAVPPPHPTDRRVRPARAFEADLVAPASAAMFIEELQSSPYGRDGGAGFRARIRSLIGAGRILVRIEHGEVIFKAEIGSVSAGACQIQGVWVHPDLRGRGLGTAAMASVLHYALSLAPLATLYVNDFNAPARRVYERLGMWQAGTFATVLF
jgi:predicted GNAT family acetyltransferase